MIHFEHAVQNCLYSFHPSLDVMAWSYCWPLAGKLTSYCLATMSGVVWPGILLFLCQAYMGSSEIWYNFLRNLSNTSLLTCIVKSSVLGSMFFYYNDGLNVLLSMSTAWTRVQWVTSSQVVTVLPSGHGWRKGYHSQADAAGRYWYCHQLPHTVQAQWRYSPQSFYLHGFKVSSYRCLLTSLFWSWKKLSI